MAWCPAVTTPVRGASGKGGTQALWASECPVPVRNLPPSVRYLVAPMDCGEQPSASSWARNAWRAPRHLT